MKVCPVCGYANPDDANYCVRCGYSFPARQAGNYWPGYLRHYDKGEVEGLQYIRDFAKYRLASILLWLASIILVVASLGFSPLTSVPVNGSDLSALASEFGVIAAASVSFLAGTALYLLGLYYLRQGFKVLNGITGDFGTAVVGTNVIVVGLIAMASGVLTFLLSLSTGLVGLAALSASVVLLGALIELLGEILAVVSGGFSLSSRYNVDELKWGGLLYVVGLLLFVVISIIGLVIYYDGLGEAIRKVKKSLDIT